jgi:hypothetical protein
MALVSRRLSPTRAEEVDTRLRARAEQLKPMRELHPRPTALGICRACTTIVYAGDSLAMVGGYLLHDACAPSGKRHSTPAA